MSDTVRAVPSITILLIASYLLFPVAVAGQTPSTAADPPSLGSSFRVETLADLPLGNNVYSVLETTQSEVIADRFNSSGLNAGEAARLGGFLGSWSQTLFRIGEVDITDPAGSGAPLLFPELLFWQRVDVTTGLMPANLNTSALGATLEPWRPAARWTTTADVSGTGGSLAAPTPSGPPPPVARLDDWAHASVLINGPLTGDRLGIVAGGTWTRASKFIRELTPASDSDLASGFVHLVYRPSTTNEWRALGWVQGAQVPFEYRRVFPADVSTEDTSTHVQSTWEHREPAGLSWRVFGGLTQRSRSSDTRQVSSLTVDRLLDGPMPAIVSATGDATARRWTLAARAGSHDTLDSPHLTEFGINFDHAQLATSDQFTGSIGELVDGAPARTWAFTHPDATSRRHARTFSAFASDRIRFSPFLRLDAAIRFESISGAADGSINGVSWNTLLPSATLRWEFADRAHMTLVAGYRRSANQLNLDLLAYGDPAAPTAMVSRWVAAPGPASTVVDLVGPGTGGDATFSSIDPNLKRPYGDEFVIGIESRPREWLHASLIGIARREANLVGAVDVGVPIASYSTVGISDPGLDFFSEADDQTLIVYNRLPSTFGRNQYLLTNPGQQAATSYALKFTAEGATERLFLLFGATASLAEGSAVNRGYGPLENDQDVAGELFTNPNAATFARGRLFSDRAFTIKWTTVYRFPADFRVGAIARYQDGQPSARLVIAPDLNQGVEAVRAFPNGRNRFTFTGTLDLRLQKGFTIGKTRMEAILDVYNLATRSNEVDEYVVTGPAFRTPTAIEPQHSIHLGLRLTF